MFEIVDAIAAVETIAEGSGIRERPRREKIYGKANWKKKKALSPLRVVPCNDPGNTGRQQVGNTFPTQRTAARLSVGKVRLDTVPAGHMLPTYGWLLPTANGERAKKKGLADIRLDNGETVRAEIHWYQAHGIGKVEHKIKRLP